MIIYLIRHGETTGDIEDRYGGDYDDHLTARGRNQAEELADKLTSRGIQKLISSPKIRARETAEIVNKKLNLPVEIVEDLRERNAYGILTGLTKTEAKQRFPHEVREVKSYKNTIAGAENYDKFWTRIEKAIVKIAKENFEVVAIISHGGPMRAVFREKLLAGSEIVVADCAFAVIEIDGDNWRLIKSYGISKEEDGQ
ncbi:histidine phosphatase family protein [Candidatus Saccharibacteria bacterium]|nr:histidine phosphatase family protein [Candidatus Saccharibacteria bacterium]MCL1963025.1 histidine phosphatase family protein [Candidatus Saccharibacteria bacterium]